MDMICKIPVQSEQLGIHDEHFDAKISGQWTPVTTHRDTMKDVQTKLNKIIKNTVQCRVPWIRLAENALNAQQRTSAVCIHSSRWMVNKTEKTTWTKEPATKSVWNQILICTTEVYLSREPLEQPITENTVNTDQLPQHLNFRNIIIIWKIEFEFETWNAVFFNITLQYEQWII